jgi:uncharacterized membrane protein
MSLFEGGHVMATATIQPQSRATAGDERRDRAAGPATASGRIDSLDLVRGLVMVLMAIDHVRVYSGVPAGGPTPGVFFTRWVTHFCAPAFVFFAGTGVFLKGQKLGRADLVRYLLTRGLLLIVLELTIIRASWTFSLDYSKFLLAGVIWMLGWCMVLLAGLIRLPVRAIGIIGLLIIIGQNLFGALGGPLPLLMHPLWEFIYPVGSEVRLGAGGPAVTVLYTIVPWIGVMAAGYAFGMVMIRPDTGRQCVRIGLAATLLFVCLGGLMAVMQGGSPDAPPLWMRFLNQRKYPASPLFLLMTLGPMIALIPFADRARGWFAQVLTTFGRVPMFYYLLHIPLIHALALVVFWLRDGAAHAERFATAPYVSMPPDQRWGLGLLYVVWLVAVAILYPLCRWYAQVKARRPDSWLRYV